MHLYTRTSLSFLLILLCTATSVLLRAQEQDADSESEALAKAAQNPIASIYSLPIQSNTNFGIDPHGRTQEILNIQPVIPIAAGPVNLINRSIAPVMYQPKAAEPSGGTFGFGDLNHTVFVSPSKASNFTWGVGPSITLPTATSERLGSGKWSLGPSFIMVATPGKLVAGALVSNVWSFAGDSERKDVNSLLFQYFINYNLPRGWYLVTSPILTSNWKAAKGDRWVVPIGGGIGRLIKLGKQPINMHVQAFSNVVRPDGGSTWTLRFQVQFLFPKG